VALMDIFAFLSLINYKIFIFRDLKIEVQLVFGNNKKYLMS